MARGEALARKPYLFGAIVAWVTDRLPEGDWLTNVPCRRSRGRRRCRGEIMAELDRASGHIAWHRPLCGDNGLIHGWEDTPWDRQHDAGAAPSSTFAGVDTLECVALTPTVERRNLNDAQRAPSAQPAFTVYLRECAERSRAVVRNLQVFRPNLTKAAV